MTPRLPPEPPKRGSSRRKGDEFQDLTALSLILELYALGEDFTVFLEYEKVHAVDDIVVFAGTAMRAVQAKYAVDPLAVYVPDDFVEDGRATRTYFRKYAQGWLQARQVHPGLTLSVELLSNRGRDSTLEGIIGADGRFTAEFVDGRKRGEARKFRLRLEDACAFSGAGRKSDFKEFLRACWFGLGRRPLAKLRAHIEGELLDHQLGVSDRSAFLALKELVERHAIELHAPITPAEVDKILRITQRRYLLPQVFPVEKDHFVRIPSFSDYLLQAINATSEGYIVVTGLPGSGKSTSLSEFFDELEKDVRFAVCRFLCFVSPNDDAAHRRLEAETLRVNLLSEVHAQFPDVLARRHDYSEHRLVEVLSELGGLLASQGRKLVILVDGLDHAERDPLVRDSVLRALPTALPHDVVIVVGTQELNNWEPLALREGRQQRHVPIPLFNLPETRAYLVDKRQLSLNEASIGQIHAKSQGLPLYLRYVTTWLQQHHGDSSTLDQMPEAGQGDIRDYYGRLWSGFERDGMSHARHVCGVLSALRFPIREEEIVDFQHGLSAVDMPAALRAVAHLLRREDGYVSVFHNSFRVFVESKLDGSTRQSIARQIADKLRTERGSSRWFAHVFRYAHEGGDGHYVLTEVNGPFVDFALQHSRPAEEIYSAINVAVQAAVSGRDLVALARLGSLHYRTKERLEHQFDYSNLARVQLVLNRVEDVLSFCCRPHERRWLVDDGVAMQVMLWCAKTDHRDLGDRLFAIFRETHAQTQWSDRHSVEALARVVGAYSKHPAKFLRWLAGATFDPDMLERRDLFAPGFEPHLEAFLDSYFRYGLADGWRHLKKIRRIFPNHLVRHLFLRLAARYCSPQEFASELDDYLLHTSPTQNLEIAGFAVSAGLPVERVRELAGQIVLPPRVRRDRAQGRELERDLDMFQWSAQVLGYEGDDIAIDRVRHHIGHAGTMYSGFLRFLLETGLCLGRAAGGRSLTPFEDATIALRELAIAGTEDEAGEMHTLRACRPVLPDALFGLTRHVAENCPDKLDAWCDELRALRDSEMWTSHWGISEYRVDYTFELQVWERLAVVPGMRTRLLPILRACAQTYTEAGALKAGSRSEHFLYLAAIAAECGWRTDAERWRDKGTACSLAYGYHKDVTLDYLTDVFEMVSRHEPEHTFERAAAVLEMAKWMPAATDGRMTEDFEQGVFRVVLQTRRQAAFALIRFFREHVGRWKMLDCLELFCVTTEGGDAEVLWALKDAFTPHFVEQGRHPRQVIRASQSLRDLGTKLEPGNVAEWAERYMAFIRTHLDPVWWPEDVRDQVKEQEGRIPHLAPERSSPGLSAPGDEFHLDGGPTTREDVELRLAESVDSFCETVDQLRSGNPHFHQWDLVNNPLRKHVQRTASLEETERLWVLAHSACDLMESESLRAIAHKLFDFGKSESAFECLLLAYQPNGYLSGSRYAPPCLIELCERDRERVTDFLVARCARSFDSDHGGFDLPRIVAGFFMACSDVEALRRVFEEYLRHCEELFAHLPGTELYRWLRGYQVDERDEAEQVVEFLLDLMGEPEIEQSRRLLRSLAGVAKMRAELVCRVVCARMPVSEPLLRGRLEVLLLALARLCPEDLARHLVQLLPLFSESHFRLRMTLIDAVRYVAASTTVAKEITAAADAAERTYSPLIAYPSRRFLLTEPSPGFVAFLQRGALFDLLNQVRGVCELLHVNPAITFSYLEQELRCHGWSELAEAQRLKHDWDGNTQDGRTVWIVPRFHTQVSEILQGFVHQAVENGRYAPNVLRALANVSHGGDPEFVAALPRVKPADIAALTVTDGDEWVAEVQAENPPVVGSLPTDGWTCIYEYRLLSQTNGSRPTFVSTLQVRSLLVAPELADKPQAWPPSGDWADAIPVVHRDENLTMEMARTRLLNAARRIPDLAAHFLPLVVTHLNSALFVGFREIAFLHPLWFAQFGLGFDETRIMSGADGIACLEDWQEGYEDDVYSRNLISAGMRLRVRNDWLRELLKSSGKALILSMTEERTKTKRFGSADDDCKYGRTAYSVFVYP